MSRKILSILTATTLSAMFALSASAQVAGPLAVNAPTQDTWDINAPNGQPMPLGKPLPAATSSILSSVPMQDTWDINAPNGASFRVAAAPAAARHSDGVHGHAPSVAAVDRVIEVTPGMRYVNVTSGETVLFKVGNQSFTWTFDKTVDHPSFDLSQIAPDGAGVQGVRIFCSPDQYERAG